MENLALATDAKSGFSDWDLYRFGLSVGARTLPKAPLQGLKRLILPEEYIRWAEAGYVLRHLDVSADQRVLDIGSPKLLSLFVAARIGARVHATDLCDYFFSSFGLYASRVLGSDRDRYHIEVQDARGLTYPSGAFDRVFSISTIEHIPDRGDTAGIREIARVLKPGGIACLTVPWKDSGYLEEWNPPSRGMYWIRSDAGRVFYQRAYDRPTLEERLIRPSGLELLDLSFWGERRIAVEDLIISRKLPRVVRWAIYPAHFPLSRLFVAELPAEQPCHKKIACLTLRKRARADESPLGVPAA